MPRSMTGFGRAQGQSGGLAVTVEIKSVNHRYFEYSSRIPRGYMFLDEKVKSFLQERIGRGKVDVYLDISAVDAVDCEVLVNTALAQEYVKALRELEQNIAARDDISVTRIAAYPDVLTVRRAAVDEQTVWEAVLAVLQEAFSVFVAMREREGCRMEQDIRGRCETISQAVARVEERSPQLVEEHMQRLAARIRELLDSAVDEQRLLTEAALFADKTAVAEETVRLRSHLAEMDRLLTREEPIGRNLDFLMQEMNREANTIGSKIQDADLARVVVGIKTELEKIREQIQNIE